MPAPARSSCTPTPVSRHHPIPPSWHRAAAGQPWANSQLVRVLLHEGEIDQAWDAAQHGGCSDDLWLRLAERRAPDHPTDAISAYQRLVEGRTPRGGPAGAAGAARGRERRVAEQTSDALGAAG